VSLIIKHGNKLSPGIGNCNIRMRREGLKKHKPIVLLSVKCDVVVSLKYTNCSSLLSVVLLKYINCSSLLCVVSLKYTNCLSLLSVVSCSAYERNVTDVNSDVVSAPLAAGAVGALWQLSLALIFKMVITVFTFGIKVR